MVRASSVALLLFSSLQRLTAHFIAESFSEGIAFSWQFFHLTSWHILTVMGDSPSHLDFSPVDDDWSLVGGVDSGLDVPPRGMAMGVQPQCKSRALPAPQYRQCVSKPRRDHVRAPECSLGGLAAPSRPHHSFDSVRSDSNGLQVPSLQCHTPLSLQQFLEDSTDVQSGCDVMTDRQLHDFSVSAKPAPLKRPRQHHPKGTAGGPGASAITRVRCAADSPVVMSLWNAVVTMYGSFSPLLQQLRLSEYRQQHYVRLVNNFAASTLVKYLSALQNIFQLLSDLRIDLATLTELQLADILVAGRLSKHSEDSMASTSMMIKSIRWGYKQLQVEGFSVAFGSLISSFQTKIPHDRKESLPFSLYILTQFERRILVRETPLQEVLILGSFLLLLFSGLRFADLQRTSPGSLQWDGTTLRGLAWRTKTSVAGTPFGLLARGFLSKGSYNWLFKYLMHLDGLLAEHGSPGVDFVIPSFSTDGLRLPIQPMSYAEGLYFLRYYLQLPWKKSPLSLGTSPQSYTIHGLKSTLISWGTQLDLSDEHKRLQGKHQAKNSSTRLYSRDDVHGALKLQSAVVAAVQKGWRPVTPLARGGQQPLSEPEFQLEQFNKSAPEYVWRFLQLFGQQIAVNDDDNFPQVQVNQVDSSASSASESSSSGSSASSQEPCQVDARPKPAPLVADEAIGALHRNTWHVMMSRQSKGDTELIQTACGRHFDVAQISKIQELDLTGNQVLCGHPGCRKGWTSVGAS
eukprot:s3009_g3.t1